MVQTLYYNWDYDKKKWNKKMGKSLKQHLEMPIKFGNQKSLL